MQLTTLETESTHRETLRCRPLKGTSILTVCLADGVPEAATLQHPNATRDGGVSTTTLWAPRPWVRGSTRATLPQAASQCENIAAMFSDMAKELSRRANEQEVK